MKKLEITNFCAIYPSIGNNFEDLWIIRKYKNSDFLIEVKYCLTSTTYP